MVLKAGLLVIFGSCLILVQTAPVQRDQIEEIEDSVEVTAQPSEYNDWHNETRQRRMRMVVGRNESVFTLLPPPIHSDTVTNRDKERRLKAIELYILEALGRTNKPPSPSPATTRITDVQVNSTDLLTQADESVKNSAKVLPRSNNAFPGELNTFEASCEVPSKVDLDTWTQPDSFRIFVNISKILENANNVITPASKPDEILEQVGVPTTPSSPRGQRASAFDFGLTPAPPTLQPPRKIPANTITDTVNVVSAKLRLYKIGRGPNAEPPKVELPKTSEFCNNTNDEIAAKHQVATSARGTIVSSNVATAEERIFVKVYWYIAPITKHHYKKKLLYSRTLLVKESGWIDFDIQKAAKMWLESKINYGLTIEVENEDNDLVDASTYFSNVHCPLTNVTESRRPLSSASASSRISPVTTATIRYPAPILELCTLTLPVTLSNDPDRQPVSYRITSRVNEPLTGDQLETNSEDSLEILYDTRSSTTLQPYQHRRRHHHSSAHRSPTSSRNSHWRDTDFGNVMQGDSPAVTESPPETTTAFYLDGDHPLKRIFATAKTYLSREEMMNRRRKHGSVLPTTSDDEDATYRFQPIILEAENIVIENSRKRR